jgi:hypothetical protein
MFFLFIHFFFQVKRIRHSYILYYCIQIIVTKYSCSEMVYNEFLMVPELFEKVRTSGIQTGLERTGLYLFTKSIFFTTFFLSHFSFFFLISCTQQQQRDILIMRDSSTITSILSEPQPTTSTISL